MRGPTEDTRVLLDCRFLGNGGAGRATELLLRGLSLVEPTNPWVLYGPEQVARWTWPNADVAVTAAAPTRWYGQRLRLPAHDVGLFMHQIRPIRTSPSVTLIHDTIPVRYARHRVDKLAKYLYLTSVARVSRRILTVSEHSRNCIQADLGVPARKIKVIRFPVDDDLVRRVNDRRNECHHRDLALYVGRFAPHKNIPRLIEAFSRTSFAADGGRLVLAGGTANERELLLQGSARMPENVEVLPAIDQSTLDGLLATARLVVLPSLEEGFGLPAWEAACCGIPVAVSESAPVKEVLGEFAGFDPRSVDGMARAIDVAAEGGSARPAPTSPTVGDFAREVIDALGEPGDATK